MAGEIPAGYSVKKIHLNASIIVICVTVDAVFVLVIREIEILIEIVPTYFLRRSVCPCFYDIFKAVFVLEVYPY